MVIYGFRQIRIAGQHKKRWSTRWLKVLPRQATNSLGTFRWKSENVSTNEVSEVVSAIPGIKEANIYGVEVPAQDGRAGMASLVTDENFLISEFYELLLDQLPKYSIPVFLRISPEIEITGTFKYKKTDLVKDGFDPNTISDELYFADVLTNQYIKLDSDLFQKIHNQEVRV